MSNRIIAVVGPTGSGKTALSVKIAEAMDGEIISIDSMQVYRGMDIGTAKVTESEKRGIPHHMIDIRDPWQSFSCAEFCDMAGRIADGIISRGKIPVLCGGTGLYLDTLLRIECFSPGVPERIRAELVNETPEALYAELLDVDPQSAEKIHPNNVKRVIRALEIYRGTGIPKSEWDRRAVRTETRYDARIVRLEYADRRGLYAAIDRRVDEMLEKGLAGECARLNLDRSSQAAQAIGYKEIYMWIDGLLSREEAVELLKKNTRNYAKRQLTWFRRYTDALTLYRDGADERQLLEEALEYCGKDLLPRRKEGKELL
ncbi:MAG: tRNA (adenosine(37)-N6)-dimethylallyltransferase MiaA [Clostridia bacterium]|nr:tRNA (adenosine(37)-N6)-dimethylallyltransferase MiaA [Clostridia bacterium]